MVAIEWIGKKAGNADRAQDRAVMNVQSDLRSGETRAWFREPDMRGKFDRHDCICANTPYPSFAGRRHDAVADTEGPELGAAWKETTPKTQ
jgi:hypothetical protein